MTGIFVQFNTESYHRNSKPIGWVEDGSGCHIWTGSCSPGGYPQVRVGGALQAVHRVRYEQEIGPIPDGMELDHFVCDNGSGGCCNPYHCRPVTPRENQLRSNSVASRNAAKTHCPRGHLLAGENLDPGPMRRHGWRECQICATARSLARKRRRTHINPERSTT